MFESIAFESACKELFEPQTDGWEFFTESHDVKIYRLYDEVSGLYQYKTYGSIDVDPETCAKVYMDIPYRRQWDSYVQELREVEENLIYWTVNFPWPMSNRDEIRGPALDQLLECLTSDPPVMYNIEGPAREMQELEVEGCKAWVVLAQSKLSESIPEKSGVIRVDDYHQSAVLTSNGKGGTKAFMHYYDNPKGMIPTWLINWAAKTGVPQFLGTMQKACQGYEKYLQSLEKGDNS